MRFEPIPNLLWNEFFTEFARHLEVEDQQQKSAVNEDDKRKGMIEFFNKAIRIFHVLFSEHFSTKNTDQKADFWIFQDQKLSSFRIYFIDWALSSIQMSYYASKI